MTWTETLITAGAIVGALVVKGVFFLIYAHAQAKKAPRKQEPYAIVQALTDEEVAASAKKEHVFITGGAGWLGRCVLVYGVLVPALEVAAPT